MQDVIVKMKDGNRFSGPLLRWRPREGWFSLFATVEGQEPPVIQLAEVESAIQKGQRVGIQRIEDVDMLERARKDGWDG